MAIQRRSLATSCNLTPAFAREMGMSKKKIVRKIEKESQQKARKAKRQEILSHKQPDIDSEKPNTTKAPERVNNPR
jgi:hypothetical protein